MIPGAGSFICAIQMPRKLSILIPVYNEYAQIEEVLRRVMEAPLPDGLEKEIIIIDDGSSDGTSRITAICRGGPIQVYRCEKNSGKGTAIRIGLEHATGEIVVIQDADLEYDPNDLKNLVEPIADGKAEVVYGSRFSGAISGMKFRYWLVNKLLVAAVWALYGCKLTDEATAYKAFSRRVLDQLHLECKRFEFCPEVTAKVLLRKLVIHEVPVTYAARSVQEGKKVRFRDAVEAFWTLLRWRFSRQFPT